MIFDRSPDDSQLEGVEEVIRALRQSGVVVAPQPQIPSLGKLIISVLFPWMFAPGVIGVVPPVVGGMFGASGYVGEFIVTLAPTIGPMLGTILGAWLQARYGRKVRVKFDDVEIEAQTPEQVETLLARLEALRQSRKVPRAKKP